MADEIDDNATGNEAAEPVQLDPFTTELEEQGFAIVDSYPVNHRLRAEALVRDGKSEDPHGHISPELIADTAARLKAEDDDAAAKAAAIPTVSPSMKVADIVAIAEAEGVDLSDATNNEQRVDAIEAARASKEG